MLGEVDLVPFEVSPLPQGPYLVFAPHPDDETFGLGGTLLLAAQAGIDIHVVIMTDGALGGKAEDITNRRKEEVQQAVDFIGVTSLHFFDFPDRSLTVNEASIGKAVSYIEQVSPAAIFFPSMMEYHPDHRATAYIIGQAVNRLSERDICCYAYDISVHGFINRLIDITSVVEKKVEAMGFYLSQLDENQYSDLVLALNRTRAYTLSETVTHAEGLYQFTRDELQDIERFTIKRVIRYWDQGAGHEMVEGHDGLLAKLGECQSERQAMKDGICMRLLAAFRKIFFSAT
jgi:LmbE family N-acetylglucosaminyl deacetylase